MVPATSTATSMRCDWMDSRVIRVSPKRQITIPLAFWKALDLSNEVECSLVDGAIVIRPLHRDQDEFSVEILKDLVAQGTPEMSWCDNSRSSAAMSNGPSGTFSKRRIGLPTDRCQRRGFVTSSVQTIDHVKSSLPAQLNATSGS